MDNLNVHGQRKWIKKVWYIYNYNGILLSYKKNEMTICGATWDATRGYHTKRSQRKAISYTT